ncbi:MAG: alpha/beta hydrolase [Acidimicrobiales bacterium]|nr:alpha/beta hydrolase [Acidimicrobiales bacterium]
MTADATARPLAPPLPPGRRVELPGRGTTFVRELPGPPGAPVVVLLHGWTASADLNWFPSYFPLARRYRVLALDHRGHGRGIRSRRPFRLEDCADDVAALANVLGIERFVAVGYSMGGPIAQLVWHRHPHHVQGVVLCATARSFAATTEERVWFAGLGTMAWASRLTPAAAQRRMASRLLSRKPERGFGAWALDEVHHNDWTKILEAGRAIGRFSSREWIGGLDAPAAVVITTGDRVVPPRRQQRLAESIPGAAVFEVAGDHDVCVMQPGLFVPTLVEAVESVLERVPVGSRGT